jgi:hypothetical protein
MQCLRSNTSPSSTGIITVFFPHGVLISTLTLSTAAHVASFVDAIAKFD